MQLKEQVFCDASKNVESILWERQKYTGNVNYLQTHMVWIAFLIYKVEVDLFK